MSEVATAAPATATVTAPAAPTTPAATTTTAPTPAAEDTILTAPVAAKPAAAAEAAPAAPEAAKPDAAKAATVPSYEIKKDLEGNVIGIEGLNLPEANRVITKDQIEKLVAYARENKLSPEQTQMLLDRSNAVLFDNEKANEVMLAERRASWRKQTMEDGEIGGAKFSETQEIAGRIIDRFASQALKKALNETGLGNHTELVRFVARIGRHLQDDKFVSGSIGKPAQQRTGAEVLYG